MLRPSTIDAGAIHMNEIKRIAVDTSKSVFTIEAVDQQDRPVVRRDLKRAQFVAFFGKLAPAELVLEACGASHHWGRELARLGHRVRLIPPQYVKPFVKRGKNDRNDAHAINEAAPRPDMSFVPVKTAEQQAAPMVLRTRDLLVGQRAQLVNALRGHASEFGVIAPKGITNVEKLLALIAADTQMPETARATLTMLGAEIARLDERLAAADAGLKARYQANPVSRQLARIPGIGPVTALTLATEITPGSFQSGRHMAAWLGLTPKARSTGGKTVLGGISRAGHERLRQLLVVGAMAVIRHAAKPGSKNASRWLLSLLERRPRKVAAAALANKMARTAWAMMSTGEAYRGNSAAGMA
jgi:transposase